MCLFTLPVKSFLHHDSSPVSHGKPQRPCSSPLRGLCSVATKTVTGKVVRIGTFQSPTGIVLGCNPSRLSFSSQWTLLFQSPTGINAGCNSSQRRPAPPDGIVVSVPYGDCVRLQPFSVASLKMKKNSAFQSPTGIKGGCNKSRQVRRSDSECFSPLRGLRLVATPRRRFGYGCRSRVSVPYGD